MWPSVLSARLPSLGASAGKAWQWADTPELAGLEAWGTDLARADRQAGVAALVAAGRHGFPSAVAAGGDEIEGCGFTGDDDDPIHDGAAVEVQLLRAARWVDDPSKAHQQKVREAFDPGRQMHVWDDDLRPQASAAYWWYYEVGQLCCAAILNGAKGKPTADSYYDWPAPVCVGRGLVVAVLGLRMPRKRLPKLVDGVRAAIAAAAEAGVLGE